MRQPYVFFSESLGALWRKTESREVVEIFDHLCFLLISKQQHVTFRKFLWIVTNRLIDTFGLHAVQFCDIRI